MYYTSLFTVQNGANASNVIRVSIKDHCLSVKMDRQASVGMF